MSKIQRTKKTDKGNTYDDCDCYELYPPAIRGLLKRWFIEPKPHVFVGTVNQRVKTKVLEYIRRNAPGLGILVVSTDSSSQGFTIDSFGETDRRPVRYCGIHLIAEDWDGRDEAAPTE